MKEFENENIDKELAELISMEVDQILQELKAEGETVDSIMAELVADDTVAEEATVAPAPELSEEAKQAEDEYLKFMMGDN